MNKYCFYIFCLPLLLLACNNNDYREEYQKEQLYDGYNVPLDTIAIDTYHAILQNGIAEKGDLQSKTIKWYDLNGFHSMTKSWLYADKGATFTLEKITRDKYSLVIAKDVSIEAPQTNPVVILSRLKRRQSGVEEWMYRHYFTADKFIEDQTTIFYSENSKIVKKASADADSLVTIEIDEFDKENRLLHKSPGISPAKQPFLSFKYGENGFLESSITYYYENNDINKQLLDTIVETYKYELDPLGNQMKKYTYRNDSLWYITEYQYGYRK